MKPTTNRLAMAALLVGGSLSLAQSVCAGPIFAYTDRDLLLSFRKTGADGGTTGPNDFEVDLGQASIYYSAAQGSTINITAFSKSQLTGAFDDLNDLSWSVAGCVPLGDTGNASVPSKTLWATAPRYLDPATPATAWGRNSSYTQGATAAKMQSVLANGAFYSGTTPADPNYNTPDAVAVPVGSGHEYGAFVGSAGNYGNTFQGNVENTTSATFTTDGLTSRSDLYELRPDTTGTQPAGKYLGYFELRTDGSMVFVAASTSTLPPVPKLGITVAGTTSTISFTSAVGATYTLHYTNSAGLTSPVASWPTSATTITGDGTVKSFQVTSTDASRFYRVSAQ